MMEHEGIRDGLFRLLRSGAIAFAGNKKLLIYGRLNCKSGKRMKMENRVFFDSEREALECGFRPCAHCMREAYLRWKSIQGSPNV